ncbi:MAG: hypothetical protein FJ313_07610, partial [Gemmatimonadetes bacterium]|nr:hypothetical protein [Gemmatimonadota bacterium]
MRLTADRRFELMGRIVAIAEDRAPSRYDEGVSLQELAELLRPEYPDVDVELLRECVEPMRWVDMVGEDGTVVNLVDQVEITEDDRIIVHDGWWRRLAVPTPAQAARLYVQAAAAAAQGGPTA